MLTLVSGCALSPKPNFVLYKSASPISCNLVIGLSEQGDNSLYKVTTTTRFSEGSFTKKEGQVVFSGLFASKSVGTKLIEISTMIKGDTLTIQNYGNRMNPYTLFSECEEKYLSLQKVEKK